MQQRQPRLGDILDDYCPRERRLTNHVVVAMIGESVKQTRCTTCDADHEYKHAAIPRQRKKGEEGALYSQVLAAVTPRKVTPAPSPMVADAEVPLPVVAAPRPSPAPPPRVSGGVADFEALFQPSEHEATADADAPVEEGPLHRRLIRAQLPRHEGQVATTRQAPDFTIRQPNPGRPKRFGGARGFRAGAAPMQNNRQGGNGTGGSGNGNVSRGNRHGSRPGGGGGGAAARPGQNRQGGGRNRSK